MELNGKLCEGSKGACPLVIKSRHAAEYKGASPLATFPHERSALRLQSRHGARASMN